MKTYKKEVLNDVGVRIRERMRALDISPAQLAVSMKVPMGTVNTWAHGHSIPKGEKLESLSKHLKINQTKLLLGT